MPTYDVECSKCGHKDEILRPMSASNPPCIKCGSKTETLITTIAEAIWYCDNPTASGRKKNNHRIDGFVDNQGKKHKIKYHHGTPVSNDGNRGYV